MLARRASAWEARWPLRRGAEGDGIVSEMDATFELRQEGEIDRVKPGWLEWRGRRVSLFEARSQLEAIHRAYFDEVGVGAASFLYHSGLRAAAGWLAPARGGHDGVEMRRAADRFAAALGTLEDLGLGAFHAQELDPTTGRATVIVDHCIEANALRERRHRGKPICHYTRGLIAGLWLLSIDVSTRLAADVVCWEVECVGTGHSRCRFELGAPALLSQLGWVEHSDGVTVRWEIVELNRRLNSSSEKLTTLADQLAERERAYQSLLDSMNDMLLVLDQRKRVIFCNRRFLESTGLTLEDALGSSPLHRIEADDRDRVEAVYDSLLSGEQASATYLFRVRRPQGMVLIESSARTIVGRSGEIAIETIGRDVTEREASREKLEAAHKELLRKERMADNDLRIAKLVHESLLPKGISRPEIDIDVKYVPVERVGGDYCHIQFPMHRYCVLTLCDVSGHGMASALLAARVSSHLRLVTMNERDPVVITSELNRFLRSHFSDTGLFVTFLALTIDLETGNASYCGAGHPGPILYRAREQTATTLASQNLPVGIIDDFLRQPPMGQFQLRPGDRLILYTDGLTETMNSLRQPLRPRGLETWLIEAKQVPLFQLGDWILERVAEFRSGPPHDDMTLLLLEMRAD